MHAADLKVGDYVTSIWWRDDHSVGRVVNLDVAVGINWLIDPHCRRTRGEASYPLSWLVDFRILSTAEVTLRLLTDTDERWRAHENAKSG